MEDKEPQVWVFEITFEFAVIATNPEAARQDLLDIEDDDWKWFKDIVRYKSMKSIGSIPLIPDEMLRRAEMVYGR